MQSASNEALLSQARDEYRQSKIEAEQARMIQRKYEALWQIVSSNQIPRPEYWKNLTTRYPGILREAEMCSLSTIRSRRSAAQCLQTEATKTRLELLTQTPYQPIIYWHDAHQLLRDIFVWRSDPAHRSKNLDSFWIWTQHKDPTSLSPSWPRRPGFLVGNQRNRPDQHTAYAWLAQLTHQKKSSLLELLVDRLGAKLTR